MTKYLVGFYVFVCCVPCFLELVRGCPCQPEYCKPIEDTSRKEVFIFSLTADANVWMKYDWTKVTTVVMVGYVSQQLMCYAHQHGARAVIIANFPKSELTDPTARSQWVSKQLQTVEANYLDGINIDFEDPISRSEKTYRDGYSSLVNEVHQKFKSVSKFYQVTVDVAWSPDCIDGRCYNIAALAQNTDFLFVMGYHERSQIFNSSACIAGPNADYYKTESGVKKYVDLGVAPYHLVLGVPWYGYKYPCLNLTKNNWCYIRRVPFRGVNCSDAAGTQGNFRDLYALSHQSTSGRIWDNASLTPYYNYRDPNSGQMYQVWYDDPQSLKLKYNMADARGLRGVGMWNADALDNSGTPSGQKQRQWMWGALPSYKQQ